MECRLIRDETQMEGLADGWRALQARIGLAPFTDYDMARLWWQHIGKPSGAALLVAACFDQGKLVGVIPFSIRKKHGVRVLRLLGNEIFYYANFLVANARVAESLWAAVLHDRSYDFANIKNIHNNTPEYAFFTTRFRVFRASPAYYVAHSGRAREAVVASLPKTLRRTIKRLDGAIAAGDGIEMGQTTTQDIPEDVLAFLMNRKRGWAQEKGKTGIFDEANSTALFEAMIHFTAARGAAVLFWLREAGRPVCATLGFIEKSVVYAHMVAFDQSAAKHSPGNYLTAQELIWASENGYGETNFMEGHDDYKAAFTKTARITNEFIVSRSWLGKIYYLLYKGLSLYRYSKSKLRSHKDI
ncbi:MAG TPA: hypothetical protein DCY07_08185 [Rhodospirillaceae bacterium]|nr:hypothetical protein [Rhodospirillaceae bacterium]